MSEDVFNGTQILVNSKDYTDTKKHQALKSSSISDYHVDLAKFRFAPVADIVSFDSTPLTRNFARNVCSKLANSTLISYSGLVDLSLSYFNK